MVRIGLISDTHGLLRPQALALLAGCDGIVHAGDICDPSVLDALRRIAPVTAVRGNNDIGPWAQELREAELLRVAAVGIFVIHDLSQLALDAATQDVQVIVSGHSHKPLVEQRGTVLHVNPGSAGPRRFKLPISVGELLIEGRSVSARIIELPVSGAPG